MRRQNRAFTLIELITVVAVTAILLAIIIIPVVRGFDLTRAAQGFADAQERARRLIDQISREVSNSANVRDTSGVGGQVTIRVPSDPDFDGAPNGYVNVRLDYAKLDILLPSEGEPITDSSGALRNPNILIDPNGDPNDPNNWAGDPTLRTPRGELNLPATQGLRLVRYFVSLNRPLATAQDGRGAELNELALADQANLRFAAAYANPYDRLLGRAEGEDNLFVLRRAEVEIQRINTATGNWEFNQELFRDVNGDGQIDSRDLDDPNFMLADGTAATANRIKAWLRRSRVVTDISRYDMIQPIFDQRTRRVVYDGATPRLLSLIQFTPSRVASEPADGRMAVRSGEEADNSVKFGPDVFTTQFGGYSNLFIRLWPSSFRNATNNVVPASSVFEPWIPGRDYNVVRNRVVANQVVGSSQYILPDGADEQNAGVEVFDISAYEAARAFDPAQPLGSRPAHFRYPFTHAMVEANTRSNWLSDTAIRENFVPLVPDRRGGRVYASFPITEVGNGTRTFNSGQDNRPRSGTGIDALPNLDTSLPGASSATRWQNPVLRPSSPSIYDNNGVQTAGSTINQRFNALWQDWNLVMPAGPGGTSTLERARDCHRFLDLRFVPTVDGEPSPLHPEFGFPRARIVPGSEVVFGPDQSKGTNRGRLIRYTRSNDINNVGVNQYFLQYVHQPEPDYAALGFTGIPANINDPTFYDPNSVLSALIQPRFRAGYLKFNSEENQPLPQGNIFVFYRFQFTEPNDVLAVDYDSRQKINIALTIKNFPQSTIPNQQTVTVRGEASVRNFVR